MLSEIFPSSSRHPKDEFAKYKLYFACILTQKHPNSINLFHFAACLVLLLDKYDPTSTEETEDSPEGREAVAKTVFYKLLTHRLKIFFLNVTALFDEMKKVPTPSSVSSPVGELQLSRDFMFSGHLAYFECMEFVLKLLLADKGPAKASALKEDIVGSVLMKLYSFRTFEVYEEEPAV